MNQYAPPLPTSVVIRIVIAIVVMVIGVMVFALQGCDSLDTLRTMFPD